MIASIGTAETCSINLSIDHGQRPASFYIGSSFVDDCFALSSPTSMTSSSNLTLSCYHQIHSAVPQSSILASSVYKQKQTTQSSLLLLTIRATNRIPQEAAESPKSRWKWCDSWLKSTKRKPLLRLATPSASGKNKRRFPFSDKWDPVPVSHLRQKKTNLEIHITTKTYQIKHELQQLLWLHGRKYKLDNKL